MAAPNYAADLTRLDDCVDATGWAEPTATGWTALSTVTGGETDDYIQNTTCNSYKVGVGVGHALFDGGAGGASS